MKRLIWLVLVAGILAAWPVGEAAAQHMVAGFGVSGGSAVIILRDDAVSRLLTKHDRLFISLGIQREFFRQNDPLNQANAPAPVIIEAQRFQVEQAELDQAIQRLGRLIREADKEKAR